MGRLRDAWHALRGYAAAQDSRASTWAASGGSATAEVGAAAPTVARGARDAVCNQPYAARIVDLWTGNAVGAGITTRCRRRHRAGRPPRCAPDGLAPTALGPGRDGPAAELPGRVAPDVSCRP